MLQSLRPSASGSPGGPIVGVDAEWVAGRNLSLLQLATHGHCLLLRLHTLVRESGELPPSLAALLGEPSVLKLGVGVGNDLRLLHEQYGVASASLVELQPLASREGFHGAGLQRLSGEVLGMRLDKRAEIRCGDWEASPLSDEQRMYAAMDAHVAIDAVRSRVASGRHRRSHGRTPSLLPPTSVPPPPCTPRPVATGPCPLSSQPKPSR
jgi:ribonuclease D